MSRYDPASIEPRWQRHWAENKTFKVVEDLDKPKYYALGMFPYPSGAGLHVGHPESYTAIDIVARYKRMNGFAVLNPMGWDAFGLPAERAAVREGRHPAEITRERVANFKGQLERLGFSYDWDREVATCDVDYYRWTQWIFLKLHEQGLAYLAEVPVNWCPAQGTVLANEEVVDGKYVETGDPVERRMMRQWMLRITQYAQRLLDDLEGLDWPHGVLEMQRQWIGRSEGAEVVFRIAGDSPEGGADSFTVYTTRPDTLFGATYCVLSPEHPLISRVTTPEQAAAVSAYCEVARNKSDMERQIAAEKEKTGVFTGSYAINPVNDEQVPIWVADYVLMGYGTGAIMAVPAHDERDHAFATKFDLPIIEVITAPEGHDVQAQAYSGDGVAVNSGAFDGLEVDAFKAAITAWLSERKLGEGTVNFKLRDWLFSRQRYWGEPFPVVHGADGSVHVLRAEDLPVELPHVDDYKPTADGRPPLARATEWIATEHDGAPVTRETNTMPQWAGSCWYYLRYMDPHNDQAAFDPDKERYWGPVDLYIGGVEHAVLHLLYARFWHKVLYDCGLVHTVEPFQRLFNQGMILAYSYRDAAGKYHPPEDAEQRGDTWFLKGTDTPLQSQIEKMSKSKYNVVNPDDIVERFGADTLRLYEMFMGPLEQVKPWQTSGCDGIHRFLARAWRLFVDEETGAARPFGVTSDEAGRALHLAIKETTEGIEALKFNTPISRMMEFVNAATPDTPCKEDAAAFVRILSPYAPHLGEELWDRLGLRAEHGELSYVPWPAWDEGALAEDTVQVVVQVGGKVRAKLEVPADMGKDELQALAMADPKVVRHLEGKTVRKVIVVPGRLVSVVAN